MNFKTLSFSLLIIQQLSFLLFYICYSNEGKENRLIEGEFFL